MHIQKIISAFLLLTQQCCFTSAATSHLRRQHADVGELDTRIIGGTEAVEDRYPYAVSLRDEFGHFCGGSLIAKDVVLTAAHCQESYYYVVISQHDMIENYDGEALYVKHDLPHPNYIEETTNADFMLVFLDGAFENADVVRLNCDSSVPAVGQEVTVMGWGDFEVDPAVSSMSDVLMNVNVNVISNEECEASKGDLGGEFMTYENQITDNMLCAGAPQRDSCQGDSGGPLVIKGDVASSDLQVGVVSWGLGCADADFPGIYARISQVYGWIEDSVCTYSSYAPESGFDCGYSQVDDYVSGSDDDGSPVVGSTGEDDDWSYDDDWVQDDDNTDDHDH